MFNTLLYKFHADAEKLIFPLLHAGNINM